jgi:signal recognition particle receptor subunit beta
MVAVNPIDREIQLKIVYYGPGLGGKTTTLQYIHEPTAPEHRGKMVSLATPVDRTLYFDYLPVRLPDIGGYTLKLQLFTVPGQVHFNATRKLVLSNADGVVFVADSQTSRADANLESLDNLMSNLTDYKIDTERFPVVFQYNKRDLENIIPIEILDEGLNRKGQPSLGTCAIRGDNIYESLELITKEVLRDLKRRDVLAREVAPKESAGDKPMGFKRRHYGLSDRVKEYSENTVRFPMEDSFKEASERIQSEREREEEQERRESVASTAHSSQAVDRPTIPAPLALSEKGTPDQPRPAAAKPPENESESRPKIPIFPFTFSALWPKDQRHRAALIEHAIAKKQHKQVVKLVKKELDRVVALHRQGVPNSSETTILALLGLDGRAYLEIARLSVSPSVDAIPHEKALAIYLYLLQAIERSK